MSMPAEYLALTQKTSPRPSAWTDVIGNTRAVAIIREAINAAKKNKTRLDHLLLFGNAGTGKTTLARIIAADMGGEVELTTASTLETATDVIRVLYRMNAAREQTGLASLLFVDEIHMIGKSTGGRQAVDAESLFPLLEDWRFDHNLIGKAIALGDGLTTITPKHTYMPTWPFTLIGATTDPGALLEPLRRRFLIRIQLDPYTEADITMILVRAAQRLGWSMDEEAAAKLATVSRLNPGEAMSLLVNAHNRAISTSRDTISLDVAQELIGRMNLFPLGLNETDIKVLKILESRMPRGVGQAELARSVGCSLSQFSQLVEPYLSLLGFIATMSRRVLTIPGLVYLAQNGQVDLNRPEVRAALAKAS